MKKIVLILNLTVFVFFPVLAFATSGACSGHGGVKCSAGPDSDGSVICNDGWRGSSVSYLSMVMCQGYSSPSTSTYTAPKTTTVAPAPTPAPTPVSEVVEAAIVGEVTNKYVEIKATTTIPKIKTTSASPVVQQIIKETPTPKKKGFWARFFGFLF